MLGMLTDAHAPGGTTYAASTTRDGDLRWDYLVS
jgi:hypothetical protein